MSFFDEDDPFDSIVREFFGTPTRGRRRETIIRGEEEDRNIDFIESDDKVYLVFELLGYDEDDMDVIVNGKELEIKAKKKNNGNMQDYLMQKLRQGIFFKRSLPGFINLKKFSYTMKNGVLEVIFEKK